MISIARRGTSHLIAVITLSLTALSASSPLTAQVCNENLVDNHVGTQSIAVPGFVAGEIGAATFEAVDPIHYPIEILRVQVHWGSQFGGAPQSLEGAIVLYDGAPPTATQIFSLPGPVLTDGVINEFDISQTPGDKIIDSGPFTVGLQLANDSTLLGPAMVIDGAGCIPGQNWVFTDAGLWMDLCSFGATGNWKISVVYCSVIGPPGPQFRRGDANLDGTFNIADAIRILDALFGTPSTPLGCDDAGDANDDGTLNIADAISALGSLFSGNPPPPAPGPDFCGLDPTDGDALDCADTSACP